MRIHIVLNISGYIQKSHSKETVRSSKAFGYGLGCDRLRGGSGYPDGINDDAGAVELGLPVAFPCKRESTRVTRGISARDLCIPACAWVGTCLETCPRINDVWRSHAVACGLCLGMELFSWRMAALPGGNGVLLGMDFIYQVAASCRIVSRCRL